MKEQQIKLLEMNSNDTNFILENKDTLNYAM